MSATSILVIAFAAMLAAAAAAQSPSPAPGMALPPAAPGPFYDGGAPVPGMELPPAAPGPFYDGGAPAPAPALDCFTYLLNLSDCLTFVEGGSNLTKPDPGCCPELANLVNTQPICLCQLLGDPSQVGISVDVNRALKLPSLCSVSTPPVSLCAAIGIPVAALSPTDAPSPSPGGEEASGPPSPGGDSGSPSNLASKSNFLIGLAALSFTYFLF